MKAIRRTVAVALVVAVAAVWALPLQAGYLSNSYSSYAYSSLGHGPWYGTVPYSNSSLNGTVDYVVFGPGEFALAFPPSTTSYHPPANELVYAYQVHSTGSSNTSALNVDIIASHLYDSIGSFPLDAGGLPPVGESFVPSGPLVYAKWNYIEPGITTGNSSVGLAFASPNTPEMLVGTLGDSGLGANIALPSPSTLMVPVPEPSTAILLAASAILLGLRRRFWCR